MQKRNLGHPGEIALLGMNLPNASLRCASACGSEEKVFIICLPGIYSSARKRALGNMPGYYRSSLAGLDSCDSGLNL